MRLRSNYTYLKSSFILYFLNVKKRYICHCFEIPSRLNVCGNEAWLSSLVSSIYIVVELSVSRFDPFIFREGTPVLLDRGWIGPKAGVGAVKIRKLLGLPGIEPRFPGRPVCDRVAILLNLVFVGKVKCAFQNSVNSGYYPKYDVKRICLLPM